MDKVVKILYDTGIIPVIKIERSQEAVPMAKALLEGGLPAAEITFRTSAAAASMRLISRDVPQIFVCAGTVLTAEQVDVAAENGAKAIIAPGTNPAVVSRALQLGLPVFPGCATPTEVEAALALGLTNLKFFPAQAMGGVRMLKALSGPYAGVRFMPTGGISPQNVGEYLRLPNVIACGGSWICAEKHLNQEDYGAIRQNAAEAADLVKKYRAP